MRSIINKELSSTIIKASLVLLAIIVLGYVGTMWWQQTYGTKKDEGAQKTTLKTVVTPIVGTIPATTPLNSTKPTTTSVSPSSTNKAPICNTSVIPYQTLAQDDPNLNQGTSYTDDPLNGSKMECSYDGGKTYATVSMIQPINKVTHVGTLVVQSTTPAPQPSPAPTGVTYQEANSECVALAATAGGGSGSYDSCMAQLGW